MVEDKFMRVLVMFDLPTKTKKDRQTGTKFRNNLIKLGFFNIMVFNTNYLYYLLLFF